MATSSMRTLCTRTFRISARAPSIQYVHRPQRAPLSRPTRFLTRSQSTAAAVAPKPAAAATSTFSSPSSTPASSSVLSKGFDDGPLPAVPESQDESDWTRSFKGLGEAAFSEEAIEVLQSPIDPQDVEIKPDGILFLPEIKYRRILNKAFKPGGWGLAPRGETIVTPQSVTREYALVVNGRLVSIARGQQDYFNPEQIPTAAEGCKSNAMMRCCKDLGIASELWDPRFIREFIKTNVKEIFVEHQVTKKRKKMFFRKDSGPVYPYKQV